ncbi:MAG: hypothetical protein ACTSP0_08715 [Alphaproteobacteria bacterium]
MIMPPKEKEFVAIGISLGYCAQMVLQNSPVTMLKRSSRNNLYGIATHI